MSEAKEYYRDPSRELGLTVLKRPERDWVYIASRGLACGEFATSRIPLILEYARTVLATESSFGVTPDFGIEAIVIHKDDIAALIGALEQVEAEL